jgi:very-short-patch-repair endonuclease
MAILGKSQGVFDLNDSDKCVGSYLKKSDVKEILQVDDNDLAAVPFHSIDKMDVVDEKQLQRLWYANEIPNAVPCKIGNTQMSLDELILSALIKKTFPEIQIERQVKVKRFKMDLKLTLENKPPVFIEFDGPSHFAPSRYGMPQNNPFRKKEIVEDETGFEVVNWAYWIQRCSSNVRAIFDNTVKGYGVLWSTEVHFGMFVFENSASIIDKITKRFNAVDESGYGYLYGGETRGRNNPEHPIIEKIRAGKENIGRLVPKGHQDKNYWLPDKLKL